MDTAVKGAVVLAVAPPLIQAAANLNNPS